MDWLYYVIKYFIETFSKRFCLCIYMQFDYYERVYYIWTERSPPCGTRYCFLDRCTVELFIVHSRYVVAMGVVIPRNHSVQVCPRARFGWVRLAGFASLFRLFSRTCLDKIQKNRYISCIYMIIKIRYQWTITGIWTVPW